MTFPDPFQDLVPTARDLRHMPEEYRQAVEKVVTSHAVNELTGAQTFDEPAIRLAPSPFYKWMVSRVTMEEYGHHVLFSRLADDLGVDWRPKRPLTLFDYPLVSWAEFGVVKAIVDLAEILQLEDLEACTYGPLRQIARRTMPEERFHVGLGRKIVQDLWARPGARDEVTAAFHKLFPVTLAFFGRADSANNRTYLRWGIKRRSNAEMRREYVRRVRAYAAELAIPLPPIPPEYADEHLEEVSP